MTDDITNQHDAPQQDDETAEATAPPAAEQPAAPAAQPPAATPPPATPEPSPAPIPPEIDALASEPDAPVEAPAPAPPEPEVVAAIDVVDPMEQLEELLMRLGTIARRAGMRTLAAEVSGDRLRALQEGRVTAIVLGEFNHGKSTLLNALLGANDEILPTGITPTTAVITHLRYAERPRATIHYDDNDRVQVDPTELPQIVAKDQSVEPQFVEVGYPSEILKDNLVLVDTPGVNDISRQRVEITYGYLPRADFIIYVLDANQVLKQSEIAFIQDRLLKSNRDRLLFVLGKIDTLSEDEREEVEAYAREKLNDMIGRAEVFPLSARRALHGQHDAGFDAFRAHLRSYLTERKAFILIDSGVSGGLRIAGMLRQNLAIKRRGYAMDRQELQRRVSAVRARIGDARKAITSNIEKIDDTTKGLKITARHNLKEFTDKFSQALPREIERASTQDIKKHLSDWIRDTYKDWLEDEGNAIARELERLAQDVIETTNRNLGEAVDALQDELGISREAADLEIDTLPYDVSVIAVGALGVSVAVFGSIFAGGLLLLAAPVLAFMFKDKAEAKLKEKALEQGQRAIREAGEKVEAEMIRVIEEHGENLKAFVEAAGDRLYRQINETLEQVLKDTETRDTDRAVLDERARLAEADVNTVIEELRAIRKALLLPSA